MTKSIHSIIVSRRDHIRAVTTDCSSLSVLQKIDQGPDHLLGRQVRLQLTKDDLKYIVSLVRNNKEIMMATEDDDAH